MEDKFLEVAKQAALEAGKIIAGYIGKKHKYNYKNEDKSDFATQADLESEQKIIQIITKNFPNHNIIAEESGQVDKNSEYTWVIDPLDGTVSFAAGMPYFAVSVGLLKKNIPILGVIYHVVTKDLYWAKVGKGAFVNGKPIKVNQKNELSSANIVMDFGHKHRRLPKIDLYVKPLMKEAGYIYAIGSSVMSLMLVARGIQDGMIAQAWTWDGVAGTVIVQEAGGKITDFSGNPIDWTNPRLSIVATNSLIHDQILEVLK